MSTDKNPWKRISSEIKYENPWITVKEDQVICPDGSEGIYGVVYSAVAVGVLAVEADHSIHLVGQYRYPMDEYSWEIIEGANEDNETLEETALRELEEEAGLRASHIEALGKEVHTSNCHSAERAFLFLAKDFEIVPTRPEGTEVFQQKQVSLDEALAMINDGQIKDALSIIAILQYAHSIRS